MAQYIHFTEEKKQRAAQVDLEFFLRSRGEEVLPSGRDKRLAKDHSVTIRGNEWYDHSSQKGGQAISFVQHYYGLSYPDAVQLLLGSSQTTNSPLTTKYEAEPQKTFTLPPANKNMRRVFAYLTQQRKIKPEIISYFAKAKLLYEDADYHNAVFVGTDERGTPRHAHKRSTNSSGKAFRQNIEGSDPKHSFHYIGKSEFLFVFEAPIDLLSYLSLHPDSWAQHSYVACCGVSSLPVLELLKLHPHIKSVYLCLDNDSAGNAASKRMKDFLVDQDISVARLSPAQKDWNDDLVARSSDSNEEVLSCQTSGS